MLMFMLSTSSIYRTAMVNFVARPIKVIQAHWDGRSRRNTVRHANVDLVQPRESGSVAKNQYLGRPAADSDLRGNHTLGNQAGAIDFQDLSDSGRIVG